MIMGIGIPSNHSRIGICVPPFSLPSSWNEAAFIPRSVAVLATLDGRETGREGAKQERGRHPERQLCSALTGTVRSCFSLGYYAVDPRLGLRLRYAGL